MTIADLYLFPVYDTREAYLKATGQEPPPFNPYRQPKGWFDPNAKQSASRRVVYERALAQDPDTGQTIIGPDGSPMLDALVLDRDEAGDVNIPPRGEGQTNVPGADQPEIPAPMRALKLTERIVQQAFGAGWTVVEAQGASFYDQVGFAAYDRALLERIAAKLGA